MLGQSRVCGVIAVANMDSGKAFYGGTLGMHPVEEKGGGVLYESGGGNIFVYESPTAGSGQATCASWQVDDVAGVVSALKAQGVLFETYDMPGVDWQGEVAVMGDMQSAWFKDPDGNILNVVKM